MRITKYVMNAPTYPIRILQPKFWWWGNLTNLPGFGGSPFQLFGLRFAFYNDMPDLQRWNGGVRRSRFWTSFLTNISFQSGHSSKTSDLISILYPILYKWMMRSEWVPKTAVLLCHYHARTRYVQKLAEAKAFAGPYISQHKPIVHHPVQSCGLHPPFSGDAPGHRKSRGGDSTDHGHHTAGRLTKGSRRTFYQSRIWPWNAPFDNYHSAWRQSKWLHTTRRDKKMPPGAFAWFRHQKDKAAGNGRAGASIRRPARCRSAQTGAHQSHHCSSDEILFSAIERSQQRCRLAAPGPRPSRAGPTAAAGNSAAPNYSGHLSADKEWLAALLASCSFWEAHADARWPRRSRRALSVPGTCPIRPAADTVTETAKTHPADAGSLLAHDWSSTE